jgi:hypothetical protein
MYLFLQPQHIVVTPRLSERFFFYILSSVLPIYLDASAWLYADFLKLPSVVVCYKSNTFKSDISFKELMRWHPQRCSTGGVVAGFKIAVSMKSEVVSAQPVDKLSTRVTTRNKKT